MARTSFWLVGCIALVSCEVRVGSQPPGNASGGTIAFPVGSTGGRMLSSDGVLLATIAPSSGATASVTVAPADLAKLKASFPEHEIAAAYELGPSGSTFSPAVAVELDLSRIPGLAQDGEMLLLWRSEGAGFVLAENLEIVEGGDTFVARGDVPHFSTVVLTRGRDVRLTFSSDDFVDVGQQLSSSGQLSATAASQANALSVVMRAQPRFALTGALQGRDFGAMNGGEQTEDRAYDPVTCQFGGMGAFDLEAQFTAYTKINNGQRTPPELVTRRRQKRVLCHVISGITTIAAAGTMPAQTFSVSRPSVTAAVGEKFVLELALVGRTGAQGLRFVETLPAILSPAAAATPAALGTATKVDIDASGASLTLAGNGGVRVEYECLAVGETGLEFATTFGPGRMTVTTRARCIAPPPPE